MGPLGPLGPLGAPRGPLGPLGALGGWFSKPGDRGVVSIFKNFTKIDIFGIFWLPNGGFGVQNGGSKLGDRSWGAAFGKHLPRNPTFGTHTVSLCGNLPSRGIAILGGWVDTSGV